MDIFISWSGKKSKFIAETLKEWLPKVIQQLYPWVSSSDVAKGARWQLEIAQRLESINFGIICLTPENINEPWILFESGALSKTIGNSHVCPVLFELSPADISGPLSQFQLTKLNNNDVYDLIKSINKLLEDQALPKKQLKETYEKWWPDLEARLKETSQNKANEYPKRTDRELIEEILFLSRESTKHPYLIEREFLYSRIQYFLAGLTPREEVIVRHTYGIMDDSTPPLTFKQLATRFKVTEKTIKKIHTKALHDLMGIIVGYLKEKI